MQYVSGVAWVVSGMFFRISFAISEKNELKAFAISISVLSVVLATWADSILHAFEVLLFIALFSISQVAFGLP